MGGRNARGKGRFGDHDGDRGRRDGMWHDPATIEWMRLDIYRLSRVRMALGLKVAKNSGVRVASEYQDG